MRFPHSKPIGIFFLVIGLSSVACLMLDAPYRSLGLAVGLLCILAAMSILGKAGRFSGALKPFISKQVRPEIWGKPLPGTKEGAILQVDSIAAVGVGLWIYLRPISGGKRIKLKIAQPTTLTVSPSGAEITFAGYAQWDSRRVKDQNNRRAPGTVVLSLA
ncbi:MAG: hypothetical protein P8Z49_03345 [Acidobacteriota bacterium]